MHGHSRSSVVRARQIDLIDWQRPINWTDPLNRGLAAWYLAVPHRTGFGSGVWRDLRGRHHSTLTGMDPPTDWLPGVRPGGFGVLDFDGSDDYVNLGAFIMDGFLDWAVAVWVYPRSFSNNPYLFGSVSTNPDSFYSFLRASPAGTLDFFFGDGTDFADMANAGATATLNTWNHICFTRNGDTVRRYLNGQDAGSPLTTSVGPLEVDQQLYMGVLNANGTPQASRYLNGQLDDLRFYGRGLSAAEVAALYHVSRRYHFGTLNRIRRPSYSRVAAAAPQDLARRSRIGPRGHRYFRNCDLWLEPR